MSVPIGRIRRGVLDTTRIARKLAAHRSDTRPPPPTAGLLPSDVAGYSSVYREHRGFSCVLGRRLGAQNCSHSLNRTTDTLQLNPSKKLSVTLRRRGLCLP